MILVNTEAVLHSADVSSHLGGVVHSACVKRTSRYAFYIADSVFVKCFSSYAG